MPRGLTLAVAALGLVFPAALAAQTRERVKITNVQFGLPKGPYGGDASRTRVVKPGQWAPVYVDLECTKDVDEKLQLVVETTDADDAVTEGVIELPPMKQGDRLAGNEFGRLAYLKPGSVYPTVKVRIKGASSGRNYSEQVEKSVETVQSPVFIVCGLGHNLGGLRMLSANQRNDEDNNQEPTGRELRGGWVETAQLTDVGLMPDQWIGYSAVDLLVLGTGANRDFWEALAAPQHERKRKALAEWVRRGGRLVVSVGTNADVLEPLKEIRDLLPVTLAAGAKRMVTQVGYEWTIRVGMNLGGQFGFRDGRSQFACVPLQPRADRPSRTLVEWVDTAARRREPLAVQGPHGLGRVTVVGFDLDRAPFSESPARTAFWDALVNQAGYQLPATNDRLERYNYGRPFDDYITRLQGSLDYFEGVPAVSFGWVALFILIYIVLIGPVDYLFLKKVVKRLEWTWITFPVIVITVSAGAYFAAYALKGRDLKINKVDVVDVDLMSNRVDGHTWFTLFSPRIQNYTIGVEPAGPVWTPANPTAAAHDTVVSWQGSVDRTRIGGGAGGLLTSKRYRYQSITDPLDPNRDLYASGLEGVPIQVWTTKAFTARWTAPLDPAKPPISADLSVSRAQDRVLVGTITNHLPVESFTDAALFWRGKAFDLGTALPTDTPRAISESADQSARDMKVWLIDSGRNHAVGPAVPGNAAGGSSPGGGNTTFLLWPALFADDVMGDSDRREAPNASLRALDQSWRVGEEHPEQAVLVLRLRTDEGLAEDKARAPEATSRLWLGELPTSGGSRPALQRTLKQETYIRVFIPVKPAPPKK